MVVKRNTWQRGAVRDALGEQDGFVSAQELHHGIVANGPQPIGLATVYRALGELVASGEADSLQSPEGEVLYRACSSSGHHHHLICRECGRTVEIAADEVEAWAQHVASAHGFSDPAHVVDIFGVCSVCSSAVRTTSPRPSV